MSQDELLPLVNERDEIIGQVWRKEANADPRKIHREIVVIVADVRDDNERGQLLIVKLGSVHMESQRLQYLKQTANFYTMAQLRAQFAFGGWR